MQNNKINASFFLSQLEETKFLRLFEYLINSQKEGTSLQPLDLPNVEILHKYVSQYEGFYYLEGGAATLDGWSADWLFQISYLPPALQQRDVFRKFYENSLRNGLKDLCSRQDLLRILSREPDFSVSSAGHDQTWFYFVSNVEAEMLPPNEMFLIARKLFEKEMGFPCHPDATKGNPIIGIGSPKTMVAGDSKAVQKFLIELLNMPSNYYLIAREGKVMVTPTTHHGLYFAASNDSINIGNIEKGLATSIGTRNILSNTDDRFALDNFSDLLNSPRTKEADIQNFLELHPQLLFALDERYVEVRPHIVLFDGRDNVLIPDFLARIEDTEIWDLIELKLPCHPITIRTENRELVSSVAAKAISQLLQYRDFFTKHENRARILKRYGIAPFEPSLTLVIGRGRPRTRYEWRSVRNFFPDVRIVSYDYLLHRARECQNKNNEAKQFV